MTFNGMYVTYTDAKGTKQTAFAGTDYEFWNSMIVRSDAQHEVEQENIKAKSKYLNDLVDYYAVPTAHPVPTKPQMTVMPDVGDAYKTDFVPPLPDPIPVVVSPSQGSGKATTNLPPMPLTDGEKSIMAGIDFIVKQQTKIMVALKIS